jgi:hypothetical protein
MLSKVANRKKTDVSNYVSPGQTPDLEIIVPTTCKDYTIPEIYSFLNLLKGKIKVDFIHIVPISLEELCDCVDKNDIHYDKAIAEKRLYSFVKKFPKMDNVTFDYKISNGDAVSSLKEQIDRGNYDMVALEVGEFCHYSNSIFSVMEVISSINIPVVLFGDKKFNPKISYGESNAEVMVQ